TMPSSWGEKTTALSPSHNRHHDYGKSQSGQYEDENGFCKHYCKITQNFNLKISKSSENFLGIFNAQKFKKNFLLFTFYFLL
ncbi:hypothetical protein, partial [uncultured Chryseobacterium sp.]|uniref:hypothetical protein n=1 Tax=uncultured Chryseobacterium sp. TaxID=259322 RepID=UPI0027DD0CEB